MIRAALITFFAITTFLLALALLQRETQVEPKTKAKTTTQTSAGEVVDDSPCDNCPLPTN